MSKIKRNGNKPQILSARQAVDYIEDNDVVAVSGAGGGIVDPYALINALHDRYVETQSPKNLTLWHSTGLGDRGDEPIGVGWTCKKSYWRALGAIT